MENGNTEWENITTKDNDENNEKITQNKTWKNVNRHFFILTFAGKPIYSRYGSEDKLITLFGVMQALVSFVQSNDDVIQAIYFGEKLLVFSIKGPIILVAVSNRRESVKILTNQLMYLYNQVVSVLTLTRVTHIFEQRQNYDLRRLLSGTESLIDHILLFTEKKAEFFLQGFECLPLTSSVRVSITDIIVSTSMKIKNLVFAILVADNKLIAHTHIKKYAIKSSDLHLLFNMVSTYKSLRNSECWIPICLPNFDSSGYLYGHITFISEESQTCLLLLTIDNGLFHELSEAKMKISEKLIQNNHIKAINNALSAPILTMDNVNIPSIKHFLYKNRKSGYILNPPMKQPYNEPEKEIELLSQYKTIHSSIYDSSGIQTPLKLIFQQFATESIIGWITEKFELYITVDPWISKSAASNTVSKLLKWIQKEENTLFILNVRTI